MADMENCIYCGMPCLPRGDWMRESSSVVYHSACIPEVRHDLVAHVKDKIAANPEAYANPAALAAALRSPRFAADMRAEPQPPRAPTKPRTLREYFIWLECSLRSERMRGRTDSYECDEFNNGRATAFDEAVSMLLGFYDPEEGNNDRT